MHCNTRLSHFTVKCESQVLQRGGAQWIQVTKGQGNSGEDWDILTRQVVMSLDMYVEQVSVMVFHVDPTNPDNSSVCTSVFCFVVVFVE